jgi:hypothetical protein
VAFVQHGTLVGGTGLTLTPSITGVTGGNSLVVVVVQTTTTNRSYTATSDVDGAFTSVAEYDPGIGHTLAVLVKHNVTAGAHTVTVTGNGGSPSFDTVVIECSDLSDSATPITSTFAGALGNTHYCAAVGSVDTTTAAFFVCAATLDGTPTTTTPGSGYTEITSTQGNRFIQYKREAAGVTDERGEWTHTVTARTERGLIVAFPEDAGTPPTATGGGGGFWFGL